jgi:MFS family permease
MPTVLPSPATPTEDQRRRISIGFINWAHAIDHYVMLIFATVVIRLALISDWSYSELIALSTPAFVAFGVFSLPAGWLADRWSRRNMMALFYVGCGVSLLAAALAPNFIVLAVALLALGLFAAIYHPVGTAMLIDQAVSRGRSVAFNGVCGNLGVALAAGTTAVLVEYLDWRGAFIVPAVICLVSGVAYLLYVPEDNRHRASRTSTPDVALPPWIGAALFGLFVMISLSAGLVFHISTVALPKLVDERLGGNISLAQFSIGRLVERFPLHLLFAAVALLQFLGLVWSAYATGTTVLIALAVTVAAIYGQVTINDLVIARYTADAWRGRVFAVRYFLTFLASGAAVWLIAVLYGRGGFDLVLTATAVIALGFVIGTALIAVLVNGAERERARVAAPAE